MLDATSPRTYYAQHGLITDPGKHAFLFDDLPTSIPALCRVVQGNLIHIFWAERQGVPLSPDRAQAAVDVRHVAGQLAAIVARDDRPLAEARPPERRQVGNCRHFATLLCAMLRHQGIPARARCGFGTYFEPGRYVDHWVCEYWREAEARWVTVDAQIDDLQREALGIDFDPCDLPPGPFLTGGQAWQKCIAGDADPDFFGILEMHGLWFVRGNLLRDLAALNKMELLPWDCWGLLLRDEQDYSASDGQLLDRVARLTNGGDRAFAEMRIMYEGDDRVRVPRVIRSFATPEGRDVDIATDRGLSGST